MTTMKVEAYLRLEEFQNIGVELSKADHILIANTQSKVNKKLKKIPPKERAKIWSKLKMFIKKWGIRTGWILIGFIIYKSSEIFDVIVRSKNYTLEYAEGVFNDFSMEIYSLDRMSRMGFLQLFENLGIPYRATDGGPLYNDGEIESMMEAVIETLIYIGEVLQPVMTFLWEPFVN